MLSLANAYRPLVMRSFFQCSSVPVEKRTSFRSYRATNIFMAFGGALLVLCIVLKVLEPMYRV
jgi:hypothetical protein